MPDADAAARYGGGWRGTRRPGGLLGAAGGRGGVGVVWLLRPGGLGADSGRLRPP